MVQLDAKKIWQEMVSKANPVRLQRWQSALVLSVVMTPTYIRPEEIPCESESASHSWRCIHTHPELTLYWERHSSGQQ